VVEYSTNRVIFSSVGEVAASGNENGGDYAFKHFTNTETSVFYRLAIHDYDGSVNYSSILRVAGNKEGIKVYPTVIRNQVLNLSIIQPVSIMRVVNANGAVVLERKLNLSPGSMAVNLPPMAKGLYMVQMITETGIQTEKIIIQ
jgi:hypothetical protein